MSREWRETIFGHAVVEALTTPTALPARVSVANLARGVAKRLGSGVADGSDPPASTVLLSRAADFDDLDLLSTEAVGRGESPLDAKSPDVSEEGWRERVATAWRELNAFDASTAPHPRSYAPQLWRRCRDRLLRWDDLVRRIDFEARPAAARPAEILDMLAQQVRRDAEALRDARQRLLAFPASQANTLAMGAATGAALTTGPTEGPGFVALWKAPDDPKAWQGAAPEASHFHDLLINRVAGARTAADLDAARRIAETMPKTADHRPAEGQFLALLLQCRAPGAAESPEFRSAVADALQVRRLAERAALGLAPATLGGADSAAEPGAGVSMPTLPERVAPWVADRVEAGDGERRLGEDWLLGATPGDWKQARDHLAEARQHYQGAMARAALVTRALTARDRAFADLPYYTGWAARVDADAQDRSVATATRLAAAWGDCPSPGRLPRPGDRHPGPTRQ